ncbi:MAG: acyltransferase [Clostridiales bacterium]|nr:acyltransferase [Clostridiales bacterium]
MNENKCSHINFIDGLKGLAALLVVMSHLYILNLGSISNAIFFALAGFMTASPFSDKKPIPDVLNFYKKKLLRLIPSYYITLLLVLLLTHERYMPVRQNLLNFLFIDSYAHLWFIQQLLLMFLLAPLIYFCLSLLEKPFPCLKNNLIKAVFVLGISIVFRLFITPRYIYIPYGTSKDPFYLYQFLNGIAVAYLYKFTQRTSFESILRKYSVLVTFAELIIIFFITVTSDEILSLFYPEMKGRYFGWLFPMSCSLIVCAFIYLLLINQTSVIPRILSIKPLIFVGKLSLQIYLIHWFFIRYIQFGNKYIDCVIITGISIATGYLLKNLTDQMVKRFL